MAVIIITMYNSYVRGRIRNKDIDIAVEEIQKLESNDYKEIVLTGIHTGSYGTGTGGVVL